MGHWAARSSRKTRYEKDMSAPPATQFVDSTKTNIGELIPFTALACCISSCNFDFPACIGCDVKSVALCLEAEFKCCKPTTGDDKYCCILFDGAYRLIWPTTCLKAVTSCCCLDMRAAFPCDEEIPCLVTLCCLTLCYKSECNLNCVRRIGELNPELDKRDAENKK